MITYCFSGTLKIFCILVPPKVELMDKTLAPSIDSHCELSATVNGIPTPKVKWFKNDQLLEADDYLHFEKAGNVCKLIFSRSIPEHSGVYRCFAENEAGTAEAHATINTYGRSCKKPIAR